MRKRKKTKRKPRCFSRGETLRRGYCYDTVKSKVVIFFIYSSGFYIGFYFGFTFLILMMMMMRHVTLGSHDMSHDIMS